MKNESIGVLAKLPDDLKYLIGPALTYGVHQFDDDVDQFLSDMTQQQFEELASLAEKVRMNHHYERVNRWLDEYEMTDYQETARLYFLFGVLDAADLKFD